MRNVYDEMKREYQHVGLGDIAYKALFYTVFTSLVLVMVAPFVYVVLSSVKPPSEFFGSPHWVPRTITFEAFRGVFKSLKPNLVNSLVISSGTAVLSLIVTIPASYVFGRKEFTGKNYLFYLIIVSLLFPHILLVIPITNLWRDLALYDTVWGMWIVNQIFVIPWSIWILTDYFEQLPPKLEEAAMVYGCNELSAIYKVVVPLSKTAIIAVGFLSFLFAWNEFLFANLLTSSSGWRPAAVQLFIDVFGRDSPHWNRLMAGTLIVSFPPIILYMISRQYLSEAFALSD